MGDLVEAVLIWRILKDLIAPFLVEHLGPRSIEWIEKKHKKRKTVQLDMPDQLIGLIDGGTVKPGKYVKGTAFFSLHTLGPATEQKGLHLRDGDEYFHHGTFDFNREQLWSSVSRTMSMEGGGPPDINDLFSPD